MNELDLTMAQARLLSAARNLVRANKQNIDIRPFFGSLETVVSAFSASEFEDWCEGVDQLVRSRLGGQTVDLERWYDWDYAKHFHEGLTTIQAADKLQGHLVE